MLRLLALLLLLANGLYFAWGHELLRGYGLGPVQQSEPQRLAQQIAPTAVRVLSAVEFKRAQEQQKAELAPKECWQAGPFDAAQSVALRTALGSLLPEGSWALEETPITARWIVYMGKYANAEALAKKRAEVAAMNLPIEALDNSALEPGFSLGGFGNKADADSALARFMARGLHTARVLQERAASSAYALQLPAVGAELKPKLAELRSALGSQALHSCK